jgi:hypothetical protein
MKAVDDQNVLAGCLALLLIAGGLVWLAVRNPDAGARSDRAAAIRDACIHRGRAAFRVRHPGVEMSREQAADLVAGCFSEAQQKSR